MSRSRVFSTVLCLVVLAIGVHQPGVCAPPEIPKFPLPVAMTSPGLSPEIAVVELLFRKAEIPVKSGEFLQPADVGDAKTLIIIIGGSGKGLGAAGIDIEDELSRAKKLLALAKERKIRVVGIHVGGEARRGENSQMFIELVTHQCNFVIVRSDGNQDGIFTKIAQENKIPLLIIEKTSELTGIFTKMFK